MILILVMYALFASAFTFGKWTLTASTPFYLTGIRMLIAGLITFSFLIVTKRSSLRIPKQYWLHILFLGFFNVFIVNGFEFWGLQYLATAETSLIYSFSPLFAILIALIFLKERIHWRGWLGVILGFVGFIVIFKVPGQLWRLPSVAELAVTIGAITAVLGWMVMKNLISQGISFVAANAYSFLLGSGFSLLTSLFFEKSPRFLNTPAFWLGMLYIALIHNVVCYNLYGYSLKRYSVAFMTFAGFSAPLFTALYGKIFLKEALASHFFLSLIFIVVGIYLYSKEQRVLANGN